MEQNTQNNSLAITSRLTTAIGIKETAQEFLTAVDEGVINPLELKVALKGFEKLIEHLKKVDEMAYDEALKYDGKVFNFHGATIEKSESLGVKYDYSNCNHPEYTTLLTQLEPLLKRKSEIEKELQGMKKKMTVVNEETGEIVEVYPPIKRSSNGLKISFKNTEQ